MEWYINNGKVLEYIKIIEIIVHVISGWNDADKWLNVLYVAESWLTMFLI
jgi:hypothetical protein